MKQKGLKYKVKKRIIQKSFKNNNRNVVYPSLLSIQTIGIIKDAETKFDFSSKKITANSQLLFLNLSDKELTKDIDQMMVSTSDLNFWGLPLNSKIKPFISEPFDLLINFTSSENDIVNFIVAKSAAKFKVGTAPFCRFCDLIINQKEFDGSLFIDELEKAFSNFNTIN